MGVTYNARFTRNMGNFESLQIEVGCTDEPRGDEKFAEAFNRVKDFVESRLFEQVDAVESEIRNIRTAADERANNK